MEKDHPLPEQIGPYRVTGCLGRGGMGEVLRGHDDRLDRPVALKRILPDIREPEKALKRFRNEARAVARLSHPAIVQVHDWEESEGQHWLVMEFVEGRTLHEVVAEGSLLSSARALEIARDIASGLAEAHDAGLVHRDLKPRNIIVSTKGPAKILDFGLAKTVRLEGSGAEGAEVQSTVASTTLTGEGQIIGTVTAMSPEQALGKKVDHRSDLFSLGILLYEMLSGVLPFRGDNPVETLTRICSAAEEPLHNLDPKIPEGVSNLVAHLLEKDPARRPKDGHQVVAEIDRLAAESTTGTEVASPSARGSQGTTQIDLEETGRFQQPAKTGGLRSPGRRLEMAIAAVVLVVAGLGLWGVRSWLESPDGMPRVDTPAVGSQAQTPEVEFSSYEFYQRGMTFLDRYDREGNIDKAIDDFQRALALNEKYAPALAGLAQAYRLNFLQGGRDSQRLQQALAVAEQAVRANEHLAFSHVSLGMVYSDLGRFEDAEKELEQALKIEPMNAAAFIGLGVVAELQSDFSRAEECYLRAIEIEPDHWLWHSFLGTLYYRTDRYDEAADAFVRELELAPDSLTGLSNLGAVYYMQGRLADAATQFQKAFQIRQNPTTYSNLGTIYFAQGLYAQAVSVFEKAVNMGGTHRYQKWANLGDAYRWTPDNEDRAREAYLRALQLLGEQLERTPADTNLRTLVPLYNAKLGDCSQALADLLKLGTLPETAATAWFQMAVAHEICGRRVEALEALEIALGAGYPKDEVQGDPELLELRQDIRYDRLATQVAS